MSPGLDSRARLEHCFRSALAAVDAGAAVTRALEEFIARRRQKGLVDLMGKLEWDTSFDYKQGRSRK